MVTALALATAAWALMMALAPVLQIRRIRRERSSRDVSIGYWVVLIVGFAFWVLYGFSLGDLVLIVPNAVAFFVGCVTVAVALRYRRPPGSRGDTARAVAPGRSSRGAPEAPLEPLRE